MRIIIPTMIFTLLAAGAAPGRAAEAAVELEAVKPESLKKKKEFEVLNLENRIAKERQNKRLRALEAEKEELKLKYELAVAKHKLESTEMETHLDRVMTENKLASERSKRELAELEAAYQKLAVENKLASEKDRAVDQELNREYTMLLNAAKIAAEKQKAEVRALQDEIMLLTNENALAAQKEKKALIEMSRQKEELKAQNDIQAERLRAMVMENEEERRDIDMASKRIDLKGKELRFMKEDLEGRIAKLRSDLELREKREDWKKEANQDPIYRADPFDPKTRGLIITDRRIPLNGPIFTGVADYVTERIHFFNNASSTQPIFLVIDRCPGGSVMEGYRIVKAIEKSRAPIHVVVKSYAASMAAVITTLADRSYAYPNAIILHHEMSTVNWGNMTQLKEQLEIAKEWERRLHNPVAEKMGLSPDNFRKEMYKHNSDGDWEEFADSAVKLKWVNEIVQEIRETGQIKNPDYEKDAKKTGRFALEEKRDPKGNRFVELPRLEPFDMYYIHNPDNYYR